MKRSVNLLMFIFFCGLLAGCGKSANPEAEEAATKAALAWLNLVDAGQYAESWEQAATMFKQAVPKESWVQTMKTLRAPHGENKTRELADSEYTTSLPNAPQGEYVIIRFVADFTNKKKAVETVTPMREGGEWKVSGYYMK